LGYEETAICKEIPRQGEAQTEERRREKSVESENEASVGEKEGCNFRQDRQGKAKQVGSAHSCECMITAIENPIRWGDIGHWDKQNRSGDTFLRVSPFFPGWAIRGCLPPDTLREANVF
jgi:hypothetical protein